MLLAVYGRAAGHSHSQMLSWMLGGAVTAAGLANGVTAASRAGGVIAVAGLGGLFHGRMGILLASVRGDGEQVGSLAARAGRGEQAGGLAGVRLIAVWRPVLLDMVFVLPVRDGRAPPAATVVLSGDGRRVMLPRRRP